MPGEHLWHPSLRHLGPIAHESVPESVLPPPKPWTLSLHSSHPGGFGIGNLIPMWYCHPEGPWAVPVTRISANLLEVGPYLLDAEYHGNPVWVTHWTIWPPEGSQWAPGHWMNPVGERMSLHPGDRLTYNVHLTLQVTP